MIDPENEEDFRNDQLDELYSAIVVCVFASFAFAFAAAVLL